MLLNFILFLTISAKLSFSRKCGISAIKANISARIINGVEAVPNSWPWVVSIYMGDTKRDSYLCTGALIDYRIVITSAQCLSEIEMALNSLSKINANINLSDLIVIVGVSDFNRRIHESNYYKIEDYIIHKKYSGNEKEFANNIGLVKLNRNVKLSTNVNFICLPNKKNSDGIIGKGVVIVGW